MTDRLGRADLHIHTLASDGTTGLDEILHHAVNVAGLDVIAITDHERIDAAFAARAMALGRGLPIEVVVGEEVTTLGGHLLALWIERAGPLAAARSGRRSPAIHEQGGIAIPAHPLVPYPLCAQGFALRRLLADPDPRFHPDGLETFNPTALGRPGHARVLRFAAEHGLASVGNSDAHAAAAIGTRLHHVPGPRPPTTCARRSWSGQTHWHGSFHGVARPARDVRAAAAQVQPRRPRRGRAAGSAGTARAAITATPADGSGRRATSREPADAWTGSLPPSGRTSRPMKIGLVTPVRLSAAGRRERARPLPLREPARCAATTSGSSRRSHGLQRASEGDVIRLGKGFSMPANGSVGTITLSPRYLSQVGDMLERERFDLLHFHEPFVPFLSPIVLRARAA